MITKQDFKDSFNIFAPKKYLRARLKILPYVVVFALAVSIILVIISAVTGIQFFQ